MLNIQYFEIGRIVNTQGVKGDVRVLPITDEPDRFLELDIVLLDNQKSMLEYHIQNVWFHKGFVIIKFEGIDDMTQAEKLKGMSIKINKEDAIKLKEDEYYISDLYDMDVYTDKNEQFGIIKDILFTGANDVYVVETLNEKKQILIPAIKQCILNVDVSQNKMTIHMMEGLE